MARIVNHWISGSNFPHRVSGLLHNKYDEDLIDFLRTEAKRTALAAIVSKAKETAEEIARAKKRVERFSQMAHGIRALCFNVDEGREDVYQFSCAIAIIAEMLEEDSQLTAKNLEELLE